jgi:hypothetical protein
MSHYESGYTNLMPTKRIFTKWMAASSKNKRARAQTRKLISQDGNTTKSILTYVIDAGFFSYHTLLTIELVSKLAKSDVNSCRPRVDLSTRSIYAGVFLRKAILVSEKWRLTGLKLVGYKPSTYTQPEIKTLDVLSLFPSLLTLHILDWRQLTCIQMLIHLPSLEKLVVEKCPVLFDVIAINSCRNIQVLTVSTCPKIYMLRLEDCARLRRANVYTCPAIDISYGLSKALTRIRIKDCGYVDPRAIKSQCPLLRKLDIT